MFVAERGILPKIFSTRSKHGTPTAGIVFNTMVIIAFSCADFGQLLELLNSVYAISLLMEYAAFVKLRLYHKDCKPFVCAGLCVMILLCSNFSHLAYTYTLSYFLKCNAHIVSQSLIGLHLWSYCHQLWGFCSSFCYPTGMFTSFVLGVWSLVTLCLSYQRCARIEGGYHMRPRFPSISMVWRPLVLLLIMQPIH